jgi:hypothetical protein
MHLRILSTMTEIASERNSTIVFPLPMELLRLFDQLRTPEQAPAGTVKSRDP